MVLSRRFQQFVTAENFAPLAFTKMHQPSELAVFFGKEHSIVCRGGNHFAVRMTVQIRSVEQNQFVLILHLAKKGCQIHLAGLVKIVCRNKGQILQTGFRRHRGRAVRRGLPECFPDGISFRIEIDQQTAVL